MSRSTDQHTGPSTDAAVGAADPAPAAPPRQRTDDTATPAPPSTATPGGVFSGTVLGERYRLRTRIGSDTAAGAEFWRAEDVVLRRDVGMTVLRRLAPEADVFGDEVDPAGLERSEEMVAAALRSGSFEHPGCARLLDVMTPDAAALPDDVLVAAVTEWIAGRSIAEAVADGLLKPAAAARAVQHLAAAAEEAHRHGFALGCDHPQRIRITLDGRAQLGFALPRPRLRPTDDVRGLGAVLFALLTASWPLSGADAARAGLAAAERTEAGDPVPPSTVRPGVPIELDALATGTSASSAGPARVRTAAAVRRILDEVVVEDDRVALFPPVPDGVPTGPGDVWQDHPSRSRDTDRRRKLTVALAALGLVAAVVVGYIAVQVGSVFSDSDTPPIVVEEPVQPVPDAAPPPDAAADGSTSTPMSGAPVGVASVSVLDDVGDQDNSDVVTRVIDDDPDTTWSTFTYRQQFPALKPGVGIVASFASAVQLSEVTIDSPSPGTRVEIRSAPTADSAVEDTVVIAEAELDDGRTAISLADSQPVEHVVVWIVRLGGGGDENVTEIGEVEFARA